MSVVLFSILFIMVSLAGWDDKTGKGVADIRP